VTDKMSEEQKAATAEARRVAQRQAQLDDEHAQRLRSLEQQAAQLRAPAAEEEHVVEDLIVGAPGLLGVSPEVLAGAAAQAGWEMTQSISIDAAKRAVEQFLTTPA
jgi:hypothetical protein